MRIPSLIFLLALSQPAAAQVTTNDQALDALKPAAPASTAGEVPPKAGEPPHGRTRHGGHTVVHTPGHPRTNPVTKPAPKLPPQVPLAPPANPVIAPPPLAMPAHPLPPPPLIPVKPDAVGAAIPLPDGVRVTFGAGVADLNPQTLEAIKAVAAAALADPAMTLGVTAWAPGKADDPSTPRRLSLDRALAARAVLINAGIVSERIRTMAKGMNDIGTGPADRVDVTKILLPQGKG